MLASRILAAGSTSQGDASDVHEQPPPEPHSPDLEAQHSAGTTFDPRQQESLGIPFAPEVPRSATEAIGALGITSSGNSSTDLSLAQSLERLGSPPRFLVETETCVAGTSFRKHDEHRAAMRAVAQERALAWTSSVEAYRDRRAETLPLRVNDGEPVYQLKNCALVAVADVMGSSSGKVAEEVTNYSQDQSNTAFGGSRLNPQGQRDGIQRFLERKFPGRLETRYKTEFPPAAEAIASMRGFPDGTRFLVDTDGHYLAGEKVGDDIFFTDYQPNTAPDIPPLISKNEIPWGRHLQGAPDRLSFWAVRPSEAGSPPFPSG